MLARSKIILSLTTLALVVALGLGWIRADQRAELLRTDPEAILASGLRPEAVAAGKAVFKRACAVCHGADGKGSRATGVPDLTDRDFLYGGGTVPEIEQIVLHGIRAGDSRGWNLASMPAYARRIPYAREPIQPLTPAGLADVVAFLRSANGADADSNAVARGRSLFSGSGGCWDCHSHDGAGDSGIGAPDLVDGIWLRGDGSVAALTRTIGFGMQGVSPAFKGRLSPYEARVVAAYVAALHPEK